MANDKDRTKMYKIESKNTMHKSGNKSSNDRTKKIKTSNKTNDGRKNGKQKQHPKLKKALKILFILMALLVLIGIGVFAAIFFGDTWEMSEEDLIIKMQNSSTYDRDGKLLHELSGEENRKIIPYKEMGEYIPKAYVAIEDERFYTHHGIDFYRTAGAIVTYITHGGSSSFGGSTITQQLVKNLMDDDDDSIARKIREWSRAYKLDTKTLSKEQILELYLNEIFMGGTVYGVESGAKYYFSKSAKDLSLAESAFLAGINDSPNYYNPFEGEDKTEIIKNKTKLVLKKMLEVKDKDGIPFITQEEYDKAVEDVDKGLKFKEGKFAARSDLSFLEVEAINQVVNELMKKYDIDRKAAEDRVYNNGYKIYTTQDTKIQKIMEKEYLKDKYIIDATDKKAEKGAHTQSGMVIMDHTNGQVVGCVGGLGDDSPTYGTNRAMYNNDGRQAGSSIKPLVAVAPALENGSITAATVFDDSYTVFGDYDPPNSYSTNKGIINVRNAIAVSSNIVNVKILVDSGIDNGIDFLNEIGMTQFNSQDDGFPSLALGGTAHGSSPLQMAAAYSMIANGGEYIEPTFFKEVKDSSGHQILKAEEIQEKKRVMTEGNAYILASILKSPVTSGTATQCRISGMDVAAKTGTTNESKDRWLCGFTPYYTGATWFGYDIPERISVPGMYNPALNIWSAIMDTIHEDKDGKRFQKPDNIVTATICLDSGKKATKSCSRTYTEEFVKGTVPDSCDGHKKVKICSETKKIATEYCTKTEEKTYLSTPEKEIKAPWKTSTGNKYQEIKDTCNKHTKETMTVKIQNVVGLTLEQAKSKLVGLTVETLSGTDNTKSDGVVLKQSIPAGGELVKGDKIILTINKVVITEPTNPDVPPTTNTIQGEVTTPPTTSNTVTTPSTPQTKPTQPSPLGDN